MRLDRLPWSRFHWLVILSLGTSWVLDGLEVTLVGAISGILGSPRTLAFTPANIGLLASCYILGAVLGALIFGWATDRYGRRKLFFVTLAIYLCGVMFSAVSWNLWSFCCFRFMTGAGIGGEYSAINSAIDELIPARLRGRVDLIVNGSYWLGAAAGSLSTIVILNRRIFPVNIGWRLGFAAGGLIGLLVCSCAVMCLRVPAGCSRTVAQWKPNASLRMSRPK
jgi:MFS family permease